jgi:hypothetical protein
MKILCAYVKHGLRDETRSSLEQFAPEADLVDVSGHDDNYWNAIAERWIGREDLLIIEQDMVITAETIPSFNACRQKWCSFGYTAVPHLGRVTACLGCTRFSVHLQRHISAEMIVRGAYQTQWIQHFMRRDEAARWTTKNPDIDMPWSCLDVRIARALFVAGYEPHDHGEIAHLHENYLPYLNLGEKRSSDYTSDQFEYFVPPLLINAGNRALYGYDDLANGILAQRTEEEGLIEIAIERTSSQLMALAVDIMKAEEWAKDYFKKQALK